MNSAQPVVQNRNAYALKSGFGLQDRDQEKEFLLQWLQQNSVNVHTLPALLRSYFQFIFWSTCENDLSGYFPSVQTVDDIVLCGEAIIYVVKDAINPLLLQMGHEWIEVKITSDHGLHTIVRYGSDREKSYVDIISATLNLAAKMQSVASGGQMIIGKILHQKLSNSRRNMFERARFPKTKWNYHNLTEQKPYQLFIATFWYYDSD